MATQAGFDEGGGSALNECADSWRRGAWQFCLFGAFLALALEMPARGQEACKLKVAQMPVTMVGMRPVARVGINGTEVPLLVDSGAFFSFLTNAAAAQLQLPLRRVPRDLETSGLTGKVDSRMTTVKVVRLLKGEIPDVDFLVGGNEIGSGVMGLLGRNILASSDTEYDLAHGEIRLASPEGDCKGRNMAYWAGEAQVVELPLLYGWSRVNPAIKAMAKLNGVDVRVMFDTGALSLVSLAAARRAGVPDADMKPTRPIGGAGRGEAKAWVAPIQKFQLGGETITNNTLRIADFDLDDVDMLLGIDFFLSHRIYVSYSQHRLFFTYNGGTVFALNAAQAPEAPASGAAQAPGAAGPTDADGYARRGAAWAARGDFARALVDLDRACELAPQAADHFVRRGVVHMQLKQWPEALRDFDTALRVDPEQREARLQRAKLRTRAGDREGALDDLQALDKKAAPQAALRLEMARVYMRLDLPDLALPQLNLWIAVREKDASLPTALNERCWVRAMLGVELDKALEDCNEAIDQQPQAASFLDSRGWVRLRRGELREAVSDYERALGIEPDMAWSLYGRGIARKRSGDTDRGGADIEAARKLLPSIDADAGRYGLAADSAPSPRAP